MNRLTGNVWKDWDHAKKCEGASKFNFEMHNMTSALPVKVWCKWDFYKCFFRRVIIDHIRIYVYILKAHPDVFVDV